jgi:autotransporter-associated beta strand protein
LGGSKQSVATFRLADGILANGTLNATDFGLENGIVSALLSGSAALTKDTQGSVLLSGANTLTGSTDINAGTLSLTGFGTLPSGSLTLTNSTSVLNLGTLPQSVASLRLAAGSLQGGSLTAATYALENGFISTALRGGAASKNTLDLCSSRVPMC